jgi:hypothetical protein
MQTRLDVILVISALALVVLVGVCGMIGLAYAGKTYDNALTALVSGAAGALASMLARTRTEDGKP